MKDTLKSKVSSLECYSLSLSTKRSDTAQLAIFVYGVDVNVINKEMAALVPFKGTKSDDLLSGKIGTLN